MASSIHRMLPKLRSSTLTAFLTRMPKPYRVASSPIPSMVMLRVVYPELPFTCSPSAELPSVPMSSFLSSPITLTHSGVEARVPLLYDVSSGCSSAAFSFVMYTTLALAFSVPSLLYAPMPSLRP